MTSVVLHLATLIPAAYWTMLARFVLYVCRIDEQRAVRCDRWATLAREHSSKKEAEKAEKIAAEFRAHAALGRKIVREQFVPRGAIVE